MGNLEIRPNNADNVHGVKAFYNPGFISPYSLQNNCTKDVQHFTHHVHNNIFVLDNFSPLATCIKH